MKFIEENVPKMQLNSWKSKGKYNNILEEIKVIGLSNFLD